MSSKVVPIRLNDEIIREIDLLIELGVFSSRGEALRRLIKQGIYADEGNQAKLRGEVGIFRQPVLLMKTLREMRRSYRESWG